VDYSTQKANILKISGNILDCSYFKDIFKIAIDKSKEIGPKLDTFIKDSQAMQLVLFN